MYVQLLENLIIPNSNHRLPKDTILIYNRKLSAEGRDFPVVEFDSKEFPLLADYRQLTSEEESIYLSEIVCTRTYQTTPVTEDYKFVDTLSSETITLKAGDRMYVDGFSYCQYDKKYVPYTSVLGIRYELHLEFMMLYNKFIEYFLKRTYNELQ